MGYFLKLGAVAFLLTNTIVLITCITPRRDVEGHVRISRTQTDEPPLTDWEIGLREATHQALLREGHADPRLRDYIQDAPFSGKQNVKVFGDIAVLARGQLYATPAGFRFVQDPYHNDCDGCHSKRKCTGDNCDHYVPYGTQQLIALWTVKRIRHRDINFGYRYEVEYTVSPVERALNEGFITKHGKFDYGIPGHVFIIKSNPRYVNGYEHNQFHSSPDQVKWHRQHVPVVGRFPQVLITHSHDPPLPDIPSRSQTVPDETVERDNKLKEIQLYRNLINSLSAKTSTTGHRFKIGTTGTSPRTTINHVTHSATPARTTLQYAEVPSKTTIFQLPSGQIVPVTQVTTSTTPEGHLQILTPVQVVRNGEAQSTQVQFVPSTSLAVTEVTKYTQAAIPNQIPSTKLPKFIMKEIIPSSSPSIKPEIVKDMGSTKLPKKTTIHFFAAEDVDKSNQEGDVDDIFSITTRKYATRKDYTKQPSRKTTNVYDDENDDLDLFPAVKPTESMSKVTEPRLRETSPSYEQISRPYQETATTQSLSSKYPSTTEVPDGQGTQRTTINLPIPGTFDHLTTPNGKSTAFYSSPTEIPPAQGTQRTTLPMPGTFDRQTTTYEIQTTPMQRKQDSTTYNYYVQSTPTPDEAIITVTPVPTVPLDHRTSDGSTLTTYGPYVYTQGRLTATPNSIEHTTGGGDLPTDNILPRSTLVFPSKQSTYGTTYSFGTTQTTQSVGLSTAQTYTESPTTTEAMFNPPPPNTFVTYYSPQTTDYHDTVHPTSETSLAQSTTSATTKMTTAIFKSSKATRIATTKLKPTTVKSSDNDFLVEEISDEDISSPISKNKSKFEEYTDDDIFGPSKPQEQKEKFANHKRQPTKNYRTSFTTEATRTVAKTPRIIYSDFYEASTVPPTTSLSQFYAESKNNYITQSLDVTTQHQPLTSQSYLTSISYKVSRKKPSIADELEVLPTIRAKLSNLHNDEKLQIFRAELPDVEENVTKKSEEKEAFDNIALQLVNHARGLDILNKKSPEENKTVPQQKKTPKYRRRSYMPKSRKNFSAKANNKKNN